MLITRANPLGGNPIKDGNFPLHQDRQGNFGLLIGYAPDMMSVGEKVLIKMADAEIFAAKFINDIEVYKRVMGKTSKPLRVKVIEFLGGSVENQK